MSETHNPEATPSIVCPNCEGSLLQYSDLTIVCDDCGSRWGPGDGSRGMEEAPLTEGEDLYEVLEEDE